MSAPATRGADAVDRDGGDAVRVILITAPSTAVAESLVRTLVGERLAACGNIVPGLTSIYRWQAEIQMDDEVLIVLKAAARSVSALLARAAELHPYDVPEVLVLPVLAGHPPYVAWVNESCG